MKRRGLNRPHQFDGTDISLLVIAAFCSLVIVFIGFRCCRRKRSARKKKAAQRKLRNRGNVENGKLLDNSSQETDNSADLNVESSNAKVGYLLEEKPGGQSKNSLTSLEDQNANTRSTSPTIIDRVMSSLRMGSKENSNEKPAEKHSSGSTFLSRKGSGKKKDGSSRNQEDSLGKISVKPGQRLSKTPKDNHPSRVNQQLKSSSSVNHSARKPTTDDPLNVSGQSAQLFGVVNDKKKKGKGSSLSKQGLNENVGCKCTGFKCKKCAPFKEKNFDNNCDGESAINKGQSAKPKVLGDSGVKTPSSKDSRSPLVNKDLGKHAIEIDYDMCSEIGDLTKEDVKMEVDDESSSIEIVEIPCDTDTNQAYTVDKVSENDRKLTKAFCEKESRSETHLNQGIVGNPSPKNMGDSKLYSRGDTDRGPVGMVTPGPGEGSVQTEVFPGQPLRKDNIIESIGDICNVTQYSRREWKSETATAVSMREGYFEIPLQLGLNNLRVIRGDNYCAIRATLFQVLAKKIAILSEMKDITKIPQELLSSGYDWIVNWNFASRIHVEKCKVCEEISACLRELRDLVTLNSQMVTEEGRASHLVSIFNFKPREFEIRLLEAVKFLMLYRAIQLHMKISAEEDVPVFAMIMFARDSSPDPKRFMMRHLNSVGDSGGLEQVEMHLLGYTLGITIRVVRPSHVGQPDFIASYPDDMPNGTPLITLVAEDDRHYNILS